MTLRAGVGGVGGGGDHDLFSEIIVYIWNVWLLKKKTYLMHNQWPLYI